jgi:glyoxylase-like metal-dependent hydrolase (beta-lactamase superfamily II)
MTGGGPPGWATLVRAPNPGPMTLDGTNTWVLRGAGAQAAVVIDPGPLDEGHLRAAGGHGPVALVLLTHRHPDHAEGARRFAEITGAPVAAADPAYCLGAEPLADGQTLDVAGLRVTVLATPGHTSDSVCFVVGAEAVLTGDTVLGRGTTVVEHPDGVLADYLASLERIAALGTVPLLPGHGPVLPDATAVARDYLDHRRMRLAQVSAALDAGARTAGDVVRRVYADVDPRVWPAAEASVRAQLVYLGREI